MAPEAQALDPLARMSADTEKPAAGAADSPTSQTPVVASVPELPIANGSPSAELQRLSPDPGSPSRLSPARQRPAASTPIADSPRGSPDPGSPPRSPSRRLLNLERQPTAALSPEQRAERAAKRAHQAAQALSFAALLLLFLACSLFFVISFRGWNQYTAAAALFCAAVAGYPALQLLWFALSSQAFRCWGKLEGYDRFEWSQKMPSLVHSVIITTAGVVIALRCNWQSPTILSDKDELAPAFIGLELGYLLQELVKEGDKQRRFRHSFPLARWVQHLGLLCALPWYFHFKRGDLLLGCLFCLSASNVALQLQWFMRAARIRGPLFLLNQIALMSSFVTLRLVFIPSLFWKFGCSPLLDALGWGACPEWQASLLCLGGSLLLLVCNAVWLVVMMRTSRVEFSVRNQPRKRRAWSPTKLE